MRNVPGELRVFLEAFPPAISKLFLATRGAVLAAAPEAHELIYNAYNAVTAAYSFSGRLKEAFCHVAAYSGYVNLGFNRGGELPDPSGVLRKLRRENSAHPRQHPRRSSSVGPQGPPSGGRRPGAGARSWAGRAHASLHHQRPRGPSVGPSACGETAAAYQADAADGRGRWCAVVLAGRRGGQESLIWPQRRLL